MDDSLAQYVDMVIDSQEYQNGIFTRSLFAKFGASFLKRRSNSNHK
jgi:hypothetical protein